MQCNLRTLHLDYKMIGDEIYQNGSLKTKSLKSIYVKMLNSCLKITNLSRLNKRQGISVTYKAQIL